MSRKNPLYDVFISHNLSDRKLAEFVAEEFQHAEVTAFLDMEGAEDASAVSDRFWEAISESRALVAVCTDTTSPTNIGFEVGASAAWNKPIFILLNGSSTTRLPRLLQNYPVFPMSRLSDLIRRIKDLQDPLTDEITEQLKNVYRNLGVTTDELISSPASLQKLTKSVNRTSGKAYSGEMLLHELIRLRKKGELPRLTKVKVE